MASSGSFNTTAYQGRYLQFSWKETGQNVANNTTTITWTLKGAGGGNVWYKSGNFKVVIDGETVFSSSTRIELDNGTVVASGNYTFKHNADGTKKFTASAQAGIYTVAVNCSGSATFTLDTIARASQPSCITWPEHTQNVGEFGDEISIHMNRNSAAFTHTVRYQFGSESGTIAENVETGVKWVIPLSLMDLIPTAASGSGTIYVDTYNGSTKIGTKWCGFTAKVPASVKPRCTIQVLDATNIQDTYGNLVRGLSKLYVKTNFYAAYSSPVASYNVNANGVRYTAEEITTGVISKAGTTTITATVKDKRGRTSDITSASFPVLDYSAPTISALAVHRCDEDGTENVRGEYVKVTFSAKITSLNSKNNALYYVLYKQTTDSTWNQVSLIDLTNVYSVSDYEYIFAADGGSSYTVEVTATDRHNSVSRGTSASTAFMLMNFGADGSSIGLLKAAERPNAIDVGGDIYMNGNAFYGAHGMFDTRDTNETPEWYMKNHGRGTVWEFKKLTAIGFTAPSAAFGPIETIIPWKDSSGGLPRQTAYEGKTCWKRVATSATTWGAWQSDALLAYPVGSIYLAFNHVSPATLFGGTWERIYGAFPWFTDANGEIGLTGGERTVTLTTKQIPSHNHGGTYTNAGTARTHAWLASGGTAMGFDTVNAGGGEAHNNMPPYIQISAWRRTA
jgi:hypothetical protein